MNFGKKSVADKRDKLTSANARTGRSAGVYALRTGFFLLLLLVVTIISLGVGILRGLIDSAPDISDVNIMPLGNASFIYDADGNELQKLTGAGGNRISISIDEIPLNMQHAIVAIEDERFYEHNGIDPSGILRAAVVGVTNGFNFTEGASTITQQLLKNNVFTDWMDENTLERFRRKFQEQYLALELEKYLTEQEIPTPTGKSGWRHRTVENILTNEKYKGDARLQKCYTVDFLSKKRKANEGEVPQYYVEGSHDAIISPSEWQLVQLEMERRRAAGRSNCCSPFSAKLKCGDCGAYFGSKVWHSNSKYKRTVWQCNAKFKGEHKCTTPHLYEQRIQELFLEALSSLMENRDSLIDDCRAVMHVLGDCKAIDREMEEVRSEMEVTTGLIQKLIDENATRKMDQNDYRKRYDGYVSRYAALESRMDSLEKERKEREFKYDIFSGFLFELGEIHELPLAFDDRLFYQLIDYATVYSDGRVVFTFRNGTEITTEM